MAQTQEATKGVTAGYQLEGTLLEACSCGVLCPCWVGEDPDAGVCQAKKRTSCRRGRRVASTCRV
jgi:hypothetical protein